MARGEREREEKRERETVETETIKVQEEAEDSGEKRQRTDTDPECSQSRQKKGQMKSIFLSDSDDEAIVDLMKQYEELFDKTHAKFKDRQRKERLWETVSAYRNLPVSTVKKRFETQRTRYGKLTQTKSGQAAAKNTERQTWLKDSFSFYDVTLEGSVQVFWIQITTATFSSFSFSSRHFMRD